MTKALNIQVSACQPIAVGNSKGVPFRFVITMLLGCVVLFGLKNLPVTSILLVDAMFCWFCAASFKHRLRYLFLLHPFVVFVLSLFYPISFLELGDGAAYVSVFESFTGGSDTKAFLQEMILTLNFNQLSLGVFPTFFIPNYLYDKPNDIVYFFWQSTFYVILVSVCLVLAKRWRVMHDDYLFYVIIFSVISPSFFELGNAVTRHYCTFIGVLLFYIAFVATVKQPEFFKIAWLFVAVALVAVSKMALFIPIYLFVVYYLVVQEKASSRFMKYLMIGLTLIFGFACFSFFQEILQYYLENISPGGVATFGFLVNVPVISVFAKYIFALLSPFPWQNVSIHIATIYGGNPLHFVMHVLSSLTGLYFFTRIIVYVKPLAKDYPELKPPIIYGLIMSLSVLVGSTGFHSYLLIYFPFFAPLFAINRYRISWMVPVGIALGFEALYTISILFV